MWVVMVIALPFILLGAVILAQALGLGQFVGRALVPNFVLGAVGALFLAAGVKIERHGDDVRVRVEKLRFVKVKSSDTVGYVELGAYLIHRPPGGGYRELAKWRDVDYRGTVAAAKAEDTLGPIEFSFRGQASQCAGGDCWLKLYAHVPLGVGSFRYENTEAVRFAFSSTR